MKFKAIFIIFNGVIVASFAFVFLMPLFLLGSDYAALFWERNWYIAILFIIVIAGLNFYFLSNWRMFMLLEKEDWDALKAFLHEKIFPKGRFSKQHVRLYIHTCLVKSDLEALKEIEGYLRKKRPGYLSSFALSLGIPHLAANDALDMQEYFGTFLDKPRVQEPEWIRWNYAYSLLMQKKRDEAKDLLLDLEKDSKDPVVRLLSLYLLDAYGASDSEIRERVDNSRSKFIRAYPKSKWEKELNKRSDNVQILVMGSLIRDAAEWMYS
ncbi:MAG: hypothetical protein K9L68_00505 [Spirochaetales bacterium]|nr:hypothetical protein [Spirochaetales bacterium]MCF7937057.1 hypothetical protein [Spirochaetales bacterium]